MVVADLLITVVNIKSLCSRCFEIDGSDRVFAGVGGHIHCVGGSMINIVAKKLVRVQFHSLPRSQGRPAERGRDPGNEVVVF